MSNPDFRSLIIADYAHEETTGTVAHAEFGVIDVSVIEYAGETVLLSRGTDEFGDWIKNIRFIPEPWPGYSGTKWHRGFLSIARGIYQWLDNRDLLDKITHVTGHSQGGGVGDILSYTLQVPGTFYCSPKSCASDTKARSKVIHYCNRFDAVVHMPPIGFKRLGETRWYSHWKLLDPAARHSVRNVKV